jgi:hypothetical protein
MGIGATGQQTAQGSFTSTGTLFWVKTEKLAGETSFQFQSGTNLVIEFWNDDELLAYVSGTSFVVYAIGVLTKGAGVCAD